MFLVILSMSYIIYYLWICYQKAWKNAPDFVPYYMYKIYFTKTDLWSKAQLLLKYFQEKGVCSAYFFDRGIRGIYVMTDPEDSLTALKACAERDYVYDIWKSWMGESIFTGSAKLNKIHRKVFSKSLMPSNTLAWIPYFNSHSGKFIDDLIRHTNEKPFDMTRILRMYNLKLLFDTMLPFEDKTSINVELYLDAVSSYSKTAIRRFENIFLQYDFMFNRSKYRKVYDTALEVLHYTSNEIIRQRRQKLKDSRHDKKDDQSGPSMLIDSFIEAADKGIIAEEDLRCNLDAVLFAGHDTTAYTMLYTLVLLGSYPEVQERAFEEIQSILGRRTDVTKEDLSKMVYLEAILKESMRIYPYSVVQLRRLEKDVNIKNHRLSTGHSVAVFVWAVHRHKSWGPDAEVFRPERWLEPDKLPKPTVLFGFSEGPRSCIGRRYAMLSMKTLLSNLVRSFRFKADHTKLTFEFIGVLEAISGHHVAIEKRV